MVGNWIDTAIIPTTIVIISLRDQPCCSSQVNSQVVFFEEKISNQHNTRSQEEKGTLCDQIPVKITDMNIPQYIKPQKKQLNQVMYVCMEE